MYTGVCFGVKYMNEYAVCLLVYFNTIIVVLISNYYRLLDWVYLIKVAQWEWESNCYTIA